MLSRMISMLLAVVVALGPIVCSFEAAQAQVRVIRVIRLDANKIKAALRTARPEENGFVDHVVALANSGQLPPQLVWIAFQWARHKPDRQFQYFKFALIVLAQRFGHRL